MTPRGSKLVAVKWSFLDHHFINVFQSYAPLPRPPWTTSFLPPLNVQIFLQFKTIIVYARKNLPFVRFKHNTRKVSQGKKKNMYISSTDFCTSPVDFISFIAVNNMKLILKSKMAFWGLCLGQLMFSGLRFELRKANVQWFEVWV